MNLLYKFGFHYHYSTSTEPATAPQNVETTAESSTEIMVTWERVLAIDENGIIINYEVRVEPLEFTESLTTSFVNTAALMVAIGSLQEYVEYNISVRAYTIVGPGPYSDPVTQRTLEDRKLVRSHIMLDSRRLLAFSFLIQDQPHLLRMWRLMLYPLLR